MFFRSKHIFQRLPAPLKNMAEHVLLAFIPIYWSDVTPALKDFLFLFVMQYL